ncbi:hypothetical protein [Bradyrhizobium liaoningense]|uniref:hypothetical protein n=1 Tax=Bradyrhizobium liaoningense TaxID=43992 RepID=UPI001BA8AC7B|nr:hypothetical protein [Bradyrhizobium liaoningense]MBR0716555.1 hypothetical protein [Bradyrhizobium liaoningense]
MSAATEDEEDEDAVELFVADFDARDRALTIHEAGHAVVARALGADVVSVEIDLTTGYGSSRSQDFSDQVNNLAVCVAGCRAENAFDARSPRRAKISDFRKMRKLLSALPEVHRRAARAEGYRLAEATLREHADKVQRLADELMARRWKDGADTVPHRA